LILVVDDDEDTRELYVATFEATGFKVRAAASIADALVVLRETTPDVLVADYSLPDGTGSALLDLCAAARPRLCVLVTGFHEREVTAGGFDLVLTKPVDFRTLVEAVRGSAAARAPATGRTPDRS
jgi:two-component system phosphate regulon response regulator PhoB